MLHSLRFHRTSFFTRLTLCLLILSPSPLVRGDDALATTKTCQADDYKYDFTECDSFGGRWRVSVPALPGECVPKGSPASPPSRVDKCFTSCESGQYFNLSTLLCDNCMAGHFSLGGGIIIHSFNDSGHLPDGFHIITESTKHSTTQSDKKCVGWVVDQHSNYLVSSMQKPTKNNVGKGKSDSASESNGCVSVVTYIAKVVKGGKLSFVYRYQLPDDLSSSLLFTFHYKLYSNDNINIDLDFDSTSNIRFPSPTTEQTFEVIEVPLRKPGFYIFTWKSIVIGNVNNNMFNGNRNTNGFSGNNQEDNSGGQKNIFQNRLSSIGLVEIKKISVEGIAYASECTPCGPGSYAESTGMSECLPCPVNTAIAGYGATQCLPCNPITEYAHGGSGTCKKRPVCGRHDLYTVPSGECDPATKKQPVQYRWIEPRVCVDSAKIISSLEPSITCTKSLKQHSEECDLGLALNTEPIGKFCRLCGRNMYRDESSKKCKRCPPFTNPYYSVMITLWNNSLPAWSSFHLDANSSAVLSEDYFGDNVNYLNAYFSRQCIRSNIDTAFSVDYSNYGFDDESTISFDDCESRTAWQPFHDYIRTGPSAILDAYLILSFTVPGFRTLSGGEITFVFETYCDEGDKCTMLFVQTNNDDNDALIMPDVGTFGPSNGGQTSLKAAKKKFTTLSHQSMNLVVKEWPQSTDERLSFRYKIERNMTVTLSWIFKRTISFQSHAKIYSILLTNSLINSAIRCQECPVINRTTANCVTCGEGEYLVKTDDKLNDTDHRVGLSADLTSKYHCQSCPPNHYINPNLSMPIDVSACIPCAENLVSDNVSHICHSNCGVRFGEATYDLRELPQPLLYQGGNLFTAGGSQYMHLYKLTLCGNPKKSMLSACLNNITTTTFDDDSRSSGVRSYICRSTIIPDDKQIYSTQSVSLGDKLIGISKNTTFNNITVHDEFTKSDPRGRDFHLYYTTSAATTACPKGRTLTITMRCLQTTDKTIGAGGGGVGGGSSPGAKALVSTPRSCPDGTCDGCNFHLLLETATAAACRLCRPFSSEDYETLAGECRDGKQLIHYINPKDCVSKHVNGTAMANVQERACKILLPKQVQIGIIMAIALAVLLLSLVFFFWNKNRSLEYKYTKLIESTGEGKGGDDLAFDNCCAEDQDENDSNAEAFDGDKEEEKNNNIGRKANNRLRGANKLFGGGGGGSSGSDESRKLFGNSSSNRIDDEGYETIHLTASSTTSTTNKYNPLV